MPTIGILSDVHGNLHALDAVREAMEARRVDEWWCLGDMVGYGAFPRETLAGCAGAARRCLAGNHDLGAAGVVPVDDFSADAARAIAWTRDALGDDGCAVLRRLPAADEDGEVALYHASPRDPVWEYILTPRQADHALIDSPRAVTMVGHTHLPMAWNLSGAEGLRRLPADRGPIALTRGRWLVNPGSVGQPRDHDPRASWAVLDTDEGTIEIVRTPYDVASAQSAIRAAGLPAVLADRLEDGR